MTRIAMWSGPRNLSTAMMYAFAARGDTAVWDEPFYAAYLAGSASAHPLAGEIMTAHETDPESVAAICAGPIPEGKPVFYMKHMPHHMMEGFPLDWAKACANIHLIRHPARVIASYAEKRAEVTLADIGFVQQERIWRTLPGPVIDSADICRDPAAMLHKLCDAIGIPFTKRMLQWPAGPRSYDGVWARHWYNAVHRSTGFAPAEGALPDIPDRLQPLLYAAMPIYEAMRAVAIKAC